MVGTVLEFLRFAWSVVARTFGVLAAIALAGRVALWILGRRKPEEDVTKRVGRWVDSLVVLFVVIAAFQQHRELDRTHKQDLARVRDSLRTCTADLAHANGALDSLQSDARGAASRRDELRWSIEHPTVIDCTTGPAEDDPKGECLLVTCEGTPVSALRTQALLFWEARPMSSSDTETVTLLLKGMYDAPRSAPIGGRGRWAFGTQSPVRSGEMVARLTSAAADSLRARGLSWGYIESRCAVRIDVVDVFGKPGSIFYLRDFHKNFERVTANDWNRFRRMADSLAGRGDEVSVSAGLSDDACGRIAHRCVQAVSKRPS